ncbi:MAG: hypothetical protein H7A51_20000 [Akkermansiaceae bacterium]|nr:hypothetical protein [Akkermansiaceae bacterium]
MPSPHRQTALNHTRQGFALIATVSVMTLLAMICLAMLSLTVVEERSSGGMRDQARAQANARMALMIALANLQRDAGPDDRATATSGLAVGSSSSSSGINPHWTAVYRTRQEGQTMTVVDRHDSPDYLTDLRNKESGLVENDLFLSWQVSHVPGTQPDPDAALGQADAIELVGTGSSPSSRSVTAPLVGIENSAGKGGYAYWVGDEGVKARLDLQRGTAPPAVGSDDYLAQFLRPSRAVLSNVANGAGEKSFPGYDQVDPGNWGKVASYREASLLGMSATPEKARDALRDNYFSLTAYHEGLLTNPVEGGFKKDLAAFLGQPMNKTQIAASEPARRDGIRGADPIIRGTRHSKTSPRYDALRRYNLTRHLVSSQSASSSVATLDPMGRLPGDSDLSLTAAQRDLGSYQLTEMGGVLPDITSVDRPNLHPVLAEATMAFDFSCYETSQPGASSQTYGLRGHLYPVAKLWNPYNVSLKTPEYILLIQCLGDGHKGFGWNGPQAMRFWAGYSTNYHAFIQYFGVHNAGYSNTNVPDSSDDRRFFGFVVSSMTLEPGETVILSPDTQQSTGTIHSPGIRSASRYDFDFSQNRLSATATPGAGSFYMDFTNQPARKDTSYGFDGDLWICERGSGEQAVLKAIPSGSGNNLTYKNITGSRADNYPTVAYVNVNPGGLYYDMNANTHCSFKTLDLGGLGGRRSAARADGSANGLGGGKRLREFTKTDIGPPPRFWRWGSRLAYYDEFGRPGNGGLMSGFSLGSNSEYSTISHANAWNPRAAMSHSGWATQNATWGMWTNGLHHQPKVSPLLNGSEGEAPFLSGNGNYIASPLSMNEGRTSEPAPDSNIVLFDVPRGNVPLISLAELRHAQLSYHPWHPCYVIGHGFADGRSQSSATIATDGEAYTMFGSPLLTPENDQRWIKNAAASMQNRRNDLSSWGWMIQDTAVSQASPAETNRDPGINATQSVQSNEILVYDIAYEANHALWDKYYVSGLAFSSYGAPEWDEDDSYQAGGIHPNPSVFEATTELENGMKTSGSDTFAYHKAGRYLSNKGAFNVNSTSEDAWRVMLSSMRGLKRFGALDGKQSSDQDAHPFSGLLFPGLSEGGKAASNTDKQVFAGYRDLTDDEINALATQIVNQVKLRGPFLSLSDFVNRRLVDINASSSPSLNSKEGTALMSALEAAIELSGINDGLHTNNGKHKDSTDDALPDARVLSHWGDKRLVPEWKSSGMPGYVSQAGVLQAIGSSLTTRSDTFVIRAYGEARNKDGTKVLARAWCEAVVQRTPDYCNPADDALEPILLPGSDDPSDVTRVLNSSLSGESQKYGRRFIVTGFRWLNPSEI